VADLIVGRPPDAAINPGPPGTVTIDFNKADLDLAFVALMAPGSYLANLDQDDSGETQSIEEFGDLWRFTVTPPLGAPWIAGEGYTPQRQPAVIRFSSIEAALAFKRPNDSIVGCRDDGKWGISAGPEESYLTLRNLALQEMGADPRLPAQHGPFDVQTIAATGAAVYLQWHPFPAHPWGASDNCPPLQVAQREMTFDQAFTLWQASLSQGGDGFNPSGGGSV